MSHHPVDVHVGARLRLRRTRLGLSQERLARAIRLTFQQLQKYESGANRISASRLFELAAVLRVPMTYFFDEMPTNALAGLSGPQNTESKQVAFPLGVHPKDEAFAGQIERITSAFHEIRNKKHRDKIVAQAEFMAASKRRSRARGRKKAH